VVRVKLGTDPSISGALDPGVFETFSLMTIFPIAVL